MLKVLIADDELSIREGLKCVIDWENCGFRICGEATNGIEALNKINELQPDLVLLDIKMPGYTGIEVMKQVDTYCSKMGTPKPAFVILSGFSDFEYAKDALNMGAKAYQLKPVDEELLEKTVKEVAEEIHTQRNLVTTSLNVKKHEVKDYLTRLLKYNDCDIPDELLNEKIFSDSDENNYTSLICAMDFFTSEDKKADLLKSIKENFSFFTNEILDIDKNIVVIIKTKNTDAIFNSVKRIVKLFQNKTFICVGDAYCGIEGVLKSYKQAESLQNCLFYFSDVPYVNMKIVSSTEKNPILQTSKIVAEEIPHIVFAIETYDKVKLQSILNKLNEYFHNTNENPDVVKKNVIYCIMETRNKLILKYPERDFSENVSDDFLTDILSKKTFEDVAIYLKQILFTFLENFNFNTTESVIVKLIAYLKNNYSEDLKLETLGDMFNCNSAYLGKKFKKYTGVQFNTYLDNIRIDVAKEKLRTTDLKIYQISKLIGFTNTDYFFMKFKKYTGLTPKEYKIQCQDGKRNEEE